MIYVRGGVPRTKPSGALSMKRSIAIEPLLARATSSVQHMLRAMPDDELEPIAVAVIEEHRRRLKTAEDLFEQLETPDAPAGDGQLELQYRIAMLDLIWQHQLVGVVVASLGRVPDVDGPRSVVLPPN
jgi:hypothetical protein